MAVQQQRRKRRSSSSSTLAVAAAQEEADLDGMRNRQVGGGDLGRANRDGNAQEARRTSSPKKGRQGYLTTLQYRTCLALPNCVCTYVQAERTRPVACCRSAAVTG